VELRVVEAGVVVADRAGGEAAEEVQHLASPDQVEEIGAVAPAQVEDEMVTIDQQVPREHGMDIFRGDAGGRRHGIAHDYLVDQDPTRG